MKKITINPFQEQYFSDDMQANDVFVDLFSAKVLQPAIDPVFQGGNVVLLGTQGCGKTMLLTLLRPEIRIAYWKCGKTFPVDEARRNFISAGINLTKSRITDLVQITLGQGDEVDSHVLPFYFGDFFNYWVVDDLIKSVEIIGENEKVFGPMVNRTYYDSFAQSVASQDCWFGALDGVHSLNDLKDKITERIIYYRRWANGNISGLQSDMSIHSTKTNIGEPIARVADCLRANEIIKEKIPVLIRVDQIEEMHRAFTDRQKNLLLSCRKMLNRVFSARDARVHYRAGSRRYGWDNNPAYMRIWGSEAKLEKYRDYMLIDMDEKLFKREEVNRSIFKHFAIDAFQKRAARSFTDEELPPQLAKTVFGQSPDAITRINRIKRTDSSVAAIDTALALDAAADDGVWTPEWKEYLRNLYAQKPDGMLDAVLAAAWGRQTGGGRLKRPNRESPPPPLDATAPWRTRTWWRKERLAQAVLQLATRCRQRMMWWGFDDICSLSGGNITVFLSICHHIWDGFLKSQNSPSGHKEPINILAGGENKIPENIQSAGILYASNEWFKKLPEDPNGNARQSLVEMLGIELSTRMADDLKMSYPGGNGISILEKEIDWYWSREDCHSEEEEQKILLSIFVRDAVGYGALFEVRHSSKIKKEEKRYKFYLNPVLCPRFQLPAAWTKEPYYWTMDKLYERVKKAGITLSNALYPHTRHAQATEQNPAREVGPYLPGWEETLK